MFDGVPIQPTVDREGSKRWWCGGRGGVVAVGKLPYTALSFSGPFMKTASFHLRIQITSDSAFTRCSVGAAVGRINLFDICFNPKHPGGSSHLGDAQMEALRACLCSQI